MRSLVIALGTSVALVGLCATAHAESAQDYAWEAPIIAPASSSPDAPVTVVLKGAALAQFRSPGYADVRVLDASGKALPFAIRLSTPEPAAPLSPATPLMPALPLYGTTPAAGMGGGSVQVQIENPGGQRSSVQVQSGSGTSASGQGNVALPAVIFDARAVDATVAGFDVDAMLPSNTPVQLSLASSADMIRWHEVPLVSRAFYQYGTSAQSHLTLELHQPLPLAGKYLRLSWGEVKLVTVKSAVGLSQPSGPSPTALTVALPDPAAVQSKAWEWDNPSSAAISALRIRNPANNGPLVLRVLGRNANGEPWRVLYNASSFMALPNHREGTDNELKVLPMPMRQLRLESASGGPLPPDVVTVSVVFLPIDLMFWPNGNAPYKLVVGQAGAASVALPVSALVGRMPTSTAPGILASLGPATQRTQPTDAPPAWLKAWLPRGASVKVIVLWSVLLMAALGLCGVAWVLLRRMRQDPPAQTPPGH